MLQLLRGLGRRIANNGKFNYALKHYDHNSGPWPAPPRKYNRLNHHYQKPRPPDELGTVSRHQFMNIYYEVRMAELGVCLNPIYWECVDLIAVSSRTMFKVDNKIYDM